MLLRILIELYDKHIVVISLLPFIQTTKMCLKMLLRIFIELYDKRIVVIHNGTELPNQKKF